MLPQFFTHMDKRARRAVAVVLSMFVVVALIAIIGRSFLDLDGGQYLSWFESFKQSDWVLPIILLTFVIGSFFGVPQWAMIAAMVVTFGSIYGGVGAWICTMFTSSLHFWMARWIGAERIRQFGGDFVNRIAAIVRRNGFVASFVIRLVPTAPFIILNMAAGISHMKFSHFVGGTALGVIPKIVIIALITIGVMSEEENALVRVGLIGIAVIFIGIMLLARKYLKRMVDQGEN